MKRIIKTNIREGGFQPSKGIQGNPPVGGLSTQLPTPQNKILFCIVVDKLIIQQILKKK